MLHAERGAFLSGGLEAIDFGPVGPVEWAGVRRTDQGRLEFDCLVFKTVHAREFLFKRGTQGHQRGLQSTALRNHGEGVCLVHGTHRSDPAFEILGTE